MFEDLLSDGKFVSAIGAFTYKPLLQTGEKTGKLWKNYRQACTFFKNQVEVEGLERLEQLASVLLDNMSVVQIVVKNPIDGPKIFDSLNSRQEPMTIGDLVRNEVFARIANEAPDVMEAVDQQSWQPFYKKFQYQNTNHFDTYFFPYGLIRDSSIKKSEVYEMLRVSWKKISDPDLIVTQLKEYQDAFLDIQCGTNLQKHSDGVFQAFRRLYDAKIPGATFPFLMKLSNAIKEGAVSGELGIRTLKLIESFLVRRAICGHEPTGLHAVFKKLWFDVDENPDPKLVEKEIRNHSTVVWPTDEAVRNAVLARPLYGTNITPYILSQWNLSFGGDQPSTTMWVEHILPQKPSEVWENDFSKEEAERLKHLLGNLLPLSKEMNLDVGRREYSFKREIYKEDSGYKATRAFAKANKKWTPDELSKRSVELADWVIGRWPEKATEM